VERAIATACIQSSYKNIIQEGSAMCHYITVSLSSRYPERNEQVLVTLRKLKEQTGIDYQLYDNPDFIEDAVDLPSIETDDGYRAYGVAAVQKFLKGPTIRQRGLINS
jgi:hypothetical protein